MKLWRYGREIERLGRRYRLEGVLGSGGMADVCLAWDERLKREVAIKVIKPNELDQRSLDRFLKEAAQIARWRHPNILRIYGDVKLELLDASQGSIVPYIVMEYAQGGDLHKRMTHGRPYPLSEMLSIFAQLCGAVAYAHSHNIIHRDLKPLNTLFRVLPNHTEQVVLSDFGLAVDTEATHFTFAGAGTLPYMAPEQLRGHAQAASDIFALGVILYQLGTGYLPFQRELHDLHQPLEPPSEPSSLNARLPIKFDDLILKALREDPAQRYPDALTMWDAIYTMIANEPELTYLLTDLGGNTSPMAPIVLTSLTTPPPLPQRKILPADSQDTPPARPSNPRGPEARQTGGAPVTKAPPTKTNISRLNTAIGTAHLTTPPVMHDPGYMNSVRTTPNQDILIRDIHDAELVDELEMNVPMLYDNNDIHTDKDFNAITPFAPPSVGTGLAPVRSNRKTNSSSNTNSDTNSRIIKRASAYNSNPVSNSATPITRSLRESLREPANQTIVLPETPHATRTGQHSSRGQSRPRTPGTRTNPTNPNTRIPRAHQSSPPPRSRMPSTRRYMLIAITCVLLLLIAGILIFMHPMHLFSTGGASTVNNTITTTTITGNYTITATGTINTDDPAHQQIPLHKLSSQVAPVTQVVTGTGHNQIAAIQATGTLTFLNGAFNTFLVKAGTAIQSASGIGFITIADIIVPSADINTGKTGTMSGPAKATQAGAQGNIAALAINSVCCMTNGTIFVKNNAPFTGGQDAQNYTFVKQSDIDQAVAGLAAQQKQQGQHAIESQLAATDRLTNNAQCTPTVTPDQRVGDTGANVPTLTATVTTTCLASAYDDSALQRLVTANLAAQVRADARLKGTTQRGALKITVGAVQVNADGTVTLQVNAVGAWG